MIDVLAVRRWAVQQLSLPCVRYHSAVLSLTQGERK